MSPTEIHLENWDHLLTGGTAWKMAERDLLDEGASIWSCKVQIEAEMKLEFLNHPNTLLLEEPSRIIVS